MNNNFRCVLTEQNHVDSKFHFGDLTTTWSKHALTKFKRTDANVVSQILVPSYSHLRGMMQVDTNLSIIEQTRFSYSGDEI